VFSNTLSFLAEVECEAVGRGIGMHARSVVVNDKGVSQGIKMDHRPKVRIEPQAFPEHYFDKYTIYRVPRISYWGSWSWPAHYHDELEVVYAPPRVAVGTVTVDGSVYRAEKGFCLVIPRGMVHSFDLYFAHRARMYIVIVNREAIITMLSRWPDCEKTAIGEALDTITVDWSHAAEQLASRLTALSAITLRSGASDGAWPSAVQRAARDTAKLFEIVSIITADSSPNRRNSESALVTRMKRLLCRDPTAAIPFSHIASQCGVSRGHASRRFNREVGMSAQEFRNCERVELAKKLLLGSDMAMALVALDCGFSDQSHFTRVFKRYAGVTPREWRKGP
jgi:AraC-like DNA-binding protein